MKRRIDLLLAAAVLVVGAAQILFTVVVDPHARCSVTPEIEGALASEGLAAQERCLTDATAYHLLGAELARSGAYERPFDRVLLDVHRPTAEYPPAFPFAISVIDRVGIDSIGGQQVALGALTAMVTAATAGLLARALGARRAIVVATVVAVGLNPLALQAHALLMTEGLFAALVGLALLLAHRVQRDGRLGTAGVLGLLLGVAALTRGEGLLWTPIIVAALVIALRATHRARRVAVAVTVLAVAAATITPWSLRNAARFDDALIPVSNNLGTVLDGANCDLTYYGSTLGAWRSTFVPGATDRTTDCFEGFRIEEPDFSEAAAAERARRDGIDYARDHLTRTPVVALARLGRSAGVFNVGQQVNLEILEGRERRWQWTGTVLWWVTLPFALGALVMLAKRSRAARRRGAAPDTGPSWVIVAIPWAAVALTTVVTYGNQRFRIGLDATAIVLALWCLDRLLTRRVTERADASGAASTPDPAGPIASSLAP
jgi:hypothetical protein